MIHSSPLSASIIDRIDPLIAERAPWLFRKSRIARMARPVLHHMLAYDRTVQIGEQIEHFNIDQIMDHMANLLCHNVQVTGLHHIPQRGAALIVANHPTGIADGIVLDHVLRRVRRDIYAYANRDILRVLPQMADMIVPVEWRHSLRSHAKTRKTMLLTRAAVDAGRLGMIFPSGRIAKRIGLCLYERQWIASAAMIAKKFSLPVIPVHIAARNSALFYVFDMIHPTLRDITLFHETLNKDRQPFQITIGAPVMPQSLPSKSEDGIQILRNATLALAGQKGSIIHLVKASRKFGSALS